MTEKDSHANHMRIGLGVLILAIMAFIVYKFRDEIQYNLSLLIELVSNVVISMTGSV